MGFLLGGDDFDSGVVVEFEKQRLRLRFLRFLVLGISLCKMNKRTYLLYIIYIGVVVCEMPRILKGNYTFRRIFHYVIGASNIAEPYDI